MKLGKKQTEQLKGFLVSSLVYGAAAFAGLVYYTDWRVITNYLPYYNGKYPPPSPEEEEEPSQC